jgi:hypothetical protein
MAVSMGEVGAEGGRSSIPSIPLLRTGILDTLLERHLHEEIGRDVETNTIDLNQISIGKIEHAAEFMVDIGFTMRSIQLVCKIDSLLARVLGGRRA